MLRLYARVVLHRGTLKAEAAGLTTLDAPVARAEHRDATGSLDVVIVSYRCRDHLSRCLASVERYAPARTSVWVVDNDSRDGTVEMVRDRFPFVSLIESTENAGFARATNRGITAGSAPYVLALNPDTELHEDTLSGLLRLMEEHPEIGIAGPRLERPDGTFDHASRRSFPTLLGALGHFSGIGRRLERGPLAQYRAPEVERGPVDAVNGAFMLIRRAALEQVGPFDEGYWMYMEDLDLCYRLREAGWLTWYEPSSVALHVKGGSAGRRSPRLVHAFHAGMSRFYDKHYAPNAAPGIATVVRFGIRARMLLVLIASAPGRAWRGSSWR